MNSSVFIAYARVSASSFSESLQSQCKDIDTYMTTQGVSYTMVFPEIESVKDGLTSNLRSIIDQNKNNKNKNKNNKKQLVLVVTSFDRITRNISDLDYLKKNIYNVIEIRSNRVIQNHEYKKMIQDSQTELATHINRAIRTHASLHAGKQLSQLQELVPSLEEKIRRATVRMIKAHTAIMNNPVNTMTEQHHEYMKDFVRISQNILSKSDWMELSMLSLRLSHGSVCVMDEYTTIVSNTNADADTVIKLSRNDVMAFAIQFYIFENVSESVMKEYILSLYNIYSLQ